MEFNGKQWKNIVGKKSEKDGYLLFSIVIEKEQDGTIYNRLRKIEDSLSGPFSVFSQLNVCETLHTFSYSLLYEESLLFPKELLSFLILPC